jgi:hypothetical protein
MTVLAISEARTNAELIVGCRELGYLSDAGEVLDTTYGKAGGFWKRYRPLGLVTNDVLPGIAEHEHDVRALPPHWAGRFAAVVFDPPYKLNGTPSHPSDDRYGVAVGATTAERLDLIEAGLVACERVLAPRGHLLVKVQDQVVSGEVVWQTNTVTTTATDLGLRLVDAMHLRSYRPQPAGRRQVHARRNYSTLLVFRKPVTR